MSKSTIRVALADDHELFRDGIRLLLSKDKEIELAGEAEDGGQIILLAAELQPDVILMDIQMPVKDGIAATKEICERFPGISVIALSMSNADNALRRILDAGAKGFLLKSASKAEIIAGIKTVYEKNFFYCQETSNKLSMMFSQKEIKEAPKPELSVRELDIMRLTCEGLNTNEISEKLFLSARTVEGYKQKLYDKLDVHSVAGLVIWAVKHKFFEP